MKETLINIRKFICFYLVLPCIVFIALITSLPFPTAVAVTSSVTESVVTSKEPTCSPTSVIEGEIGIPEGSFPIIAKSLSKNYNILNDTNEIIDENELLSSPLPHTEDLPLVLVVHTHGTECYADTSFSSVDVDGNHGFYTDNTQTRTTDTNSNVVAVGEVFCMTLAEYGIPTIQCRIMHDKDDYNSAYSNSRKSILEYLEQFPSIRYVIDLHRDSLGGNGDKKIKTVAEKIENTAQVMLVAGCNGNGVVYPNWKENLSVALKYKKVMDNKYPSLSRPIYLRYSRYNLDVTVGSLLLEVGSCGNTLDEAVNAARLAAECFAEMLK